MDFRFSGMADRRSDYALGGADGVCLPAHLPHSTSADKDQAGLLQSSLDRPVLAPTALVPSADQAPGAQAGGSPATVVTPAAGDLHLTCLELS